MPLSTFPTFRPTPILATNFLWHSKESHRKKWRWKWWEGENFSFAVVTRYNKNRNQWHFLLNSQKIKVQSYNWEAWYTYSVFLCAINSWRSFFVCLYILTNWKFVVTINYKKLANYSLVTFVHCILGAMTSLPVLTSPRLRHACSLQGDNLIVSGGYAGNSSISLVEKLDLK
jgi:hypothetical protein